MCCTLAPHLLAWAKPRIPAVLCVPVLATLAAKAELAELSQKVDKVWAARLEQPDPLVQGCHREEVSQQGCSC